MSEPATTPPTIKNLDANAALADLGEPNKPTVTAPPPPAGKLVDQLGTRFDDLVHERDRNGNPKMRADGGWMLKRGNGARKARGEPVAGRASKGFVSVADKPAPENGSGSPGANGEVINALPAPEAAPQLLEADYEGTAIGLTNGGFSLMQLWLGKAWAPEPMEFDTWRGALRRLWFHYHLPRVGPLIEVLLLIPATIAKRRDDARTREGWDKFRAWAGLKPKPKPEPKPADAERRVA